MLKPPTPTPLDIPEILRAQFPIPSLLFQNLAMKPYIAQSPIGGGSSLASGHLFCTIIGLAWGWSPVNASGGGTMGCNPGSCFSRVGISAFVQWAMRIALGDGRKSHNLQQHFSGWKLSLRNSDLDNGLTREKSRDGESISEGTLVPWEVKAEERESTFRLTHFCYSNSVLTIEIVLVFIVLVSLFWLHWRLTCCEFPRAMVYKVDGHIGLLHKYITFFGCWIPELSFNTVPYCCIK